MLLALAGTPGIIYLVSRSTPFKAPWALLPTDSRSSALAFSPDGKTLAVSSSDYKERGVVTLWDVTSQRPEATLPAPALFAMAFSPDGKTLAVADGGVQLWDIASRRRIAALPVTADDDIFGAITFSPDGSIVAVVDYEAARVQAWDVGSHRKITTTKHPGVHVTVSRGYDKGVAQTLWLWDLPGRNAQVGVIGQDGNTTGLGFTLAGTAFPSLPRLRLWDAATHRQITALTDLSNKTLALSPDGKYFTDWSDSAPYALMDARTGHKIANLTHSGGLVVPQVFSPDGKSLAARLGNGEIGLWRVP